MSWPLRAALVAVLLMLTPAAVTAQDTDYYVDAETGDDTSGDGSALSPWRTLTHAVRETAGAWYPRYHLAEGVYEPAGGERFPIFPPAYAIVQGAGEERTLIRTDGATQAFILSPFEAYGEFAILDLTLEGYGAGGTRAGFALLSEGCDLRIERLTIRGFGFAVVNDAIGGDAGPLEWPARAVVEVRDSSLLDNAWAVELYAYQPARWSLLASLRMENSVVARNHRTVSVAAGCMAWCGDHLGALIDVQLWNNSLVDNTDSGVRAEVIEGSAGEIGTGVEIVNNVFALNTGYGIDDSALASSAITTNTFWLNTLGPYATGAGTTPDNLFVDPLLADPAAGDYRLTPGSPCIDAGTDDGAPAHDRLLAARPQDGDGDDNAVTDIGAYELPEASPVVLRRGDFSSLRPLVPARLSLFPFADTNPLTPVVKEDLVSGDADPTEGILRDTAWPLAFYQVDSDASIRLVKALATESVAVFLR